MTNDPLDELDYYTLLGVDDDAPLSSIRHAFQRFAARYHPDRHIARAAEERDRADRIFRRGTEAYRALVCPDARRVYDQGLARGEIRLAPGAAARSASTRPPPPGTIDSHVPRARPFLATALAAMAAGDFARAKLNLKLVAQHDPHNVAVETKLAEIEARTKKLAPARR